MTSQLPGTGDLLDAANGIQADTVELRRAIHKDPELGLDLPKTQAKVLEALTGLGLDVNTGESCTSVVADLDTGKPGPTVLLRGDMDALPLQEDNDVDFCSVQEGMMHACGHDAHTSMLVSAARLLAEHKGEFTGKVRFMFQPGEEGFHGARYMIEEGVLDGVDRAFAIHVTPNIPSALMATRAGPLMASADTFDLTVRGRGGHASTPHFTADPIPAAASIVTGLNTMVTRDLDANQPGVLTVANLHAGTTTNVIPDKAIIGGTIRALSEHSRSVLHEGVERVATATASAHKCSCEVSIERGYPVTVNHADQVDLVAQVAERTLGENHFITMPTPIMGAEDFSYVLQSVPGAMAFLGLCPDGVDASQAASNHSNLMRISEDGMATGVAMYAAMAMAAS